MPHRLHRGTPLSKRAQRIDRLMLPAVTLLLLLGAAFVIIAWSEAEDAVSVSQRKDELRADRIASSVSEVIDRRWMDLEQWTERNSELLQPGQEAALGKELARRAGADASTVNLAWVVVRADGSFAAIGEHVPGRIVANGIADDLRTMGRTISARNEPMVSGRLVFGDDLVYAAGVPVDSVRSPKGGRSALIVVNYLKRSSIGAFIDDDETSEVDAVSLADRRGRVLLGHQTFKPDGRVKRPVGGTGWSVEYTREKIRTLVPRWAYPVFAALLALFALAYLAQDLNRRRLRRAGDERAHRVHALYELASRVLHAETVEEQASDLARSAVELAGVDGATVRVTPHGGEGEGEGLERAAGEPCDGSGRAKVTRFEIAGPRETVGELLVARVGAPLDDEETWVLQTATTLVGAAMHTLVALETERAAKEELERLDELRSNLLATVAHELLSPLTSVKGVLGLLAMQDDLGGKGQEYVEVATERTDKLVALIRDLFDCSLLETGQLDIRPRRQRADELLESALGAQAAARQGELRLSATPNLQITVDPVRFDQLVNNLVTNAFRHGAPPIEVAVRPWGDDGAMVIVSDEGKGIRPEDRDQIFGKFWQGSSGHARMVQGAGLGLSLVQGLVRVHGGDIEIDSTHADGRGARFTAYFPRHVPGFDDEDVVEGTASGDVPGLGDESTPSLG